MYLWDVNALVEDFKEKRVSQRERLKYFLVFMGLCIVEAGIYFVNLIKAAPVVVVELWLVVIVTFRPFDPLRGSSPFGVQAPFRRLRRSKFVGPAASRITRTYHGLPSQTCQ